MFASPATVSPASPQSVPRYAPRRIVIPTTRPARVQTTVQTHKPRPSILTKAVRHPTPEPTLPTFTSSPAPWVSNLGRFDVVHAQTEMDGFKMYTVDKWVTQRTILPPCVLVWTGKPDDKITVTVLAPRSDLSEKEAREEIDNVTQLYRKDGSRPRETREGIIFETNLSTFRHDLILLLIPGGNFLALRAQLYTNINLLRIGCAGRVSLGLEEPTESTQGRFLQFYCIPESKRQIQDVVLELIHMVQSGLAVFGLYSLERDGLLCDRTLDAIQTWASEVGTKLTTIDFSGRALDPPVVAALLSIVISLRNRLHVLNNSQGSARDPFNDPTSLLHAHALFFDSTTGRGTGSSSAMNKPSAVTTTTFQTISTAFERGNRARGDTFRVHRVIPDIARFAQLVAATAALKERDRESIPSSVRVLWTGQHELGTATHRFRSKTMDEMAAVRADEPDAVSISRFNTDEPESSGQFRSRVKNNFNTLRNRSRKGLDQIDMGPSTSAKPLLPALVIQGVDDFSGGELSPNGPGATNLNQSDDDMSGGDIVASRRRNINNRMRDAVASWHYPTSGPESVSDQHRPLFHHAHTLPARIEQQIYGLETRFDYEDIAEELGASDDEHNTRVRNKQRRFAARHKRHRSFTDADLIGDEQRLDVQDMDLDVNLQWEKRQFAAQERYAARLAVVLQCVVNELKDTNHRLQDEFESTRKLADELEVALGTLEENAKTEAERAKAHTRKTEEIAYRVESHQARLETDLRTVLDKRRELWAARAAELTAHTRPDGYSMLRGIGPRKRVMVDMEGRTAEEAEEEARLAGHETPLFPPDELEGSRRRALMNWVLQLPGSLWRGTSTDIGSPTSSHHTSAPEEADEAGYSPRSAHRISTWEWLTRQNPRRLPADDTVSEGNAVRAYGASTSKQLPVPERNLITFADDDEDSEGYMSAQS
ncbi:hypothetical protein BKA62DRAFT_767011 [Auriculariales sp. MPI-PUGE-AT-0066]|nr:hypothetical protein BKA62DRAFT_767011 [Auriculariales sp. MPI-PUGE-AT-0066]